MLEKLFKLSEYGTNVRTEILAGGHDFPDHGLHYFC